MAASSHPAWRTPRALLTIGLGCAAVWLLMAALFRAEDGLGADITWLVSTVIAIVGVAAFVLAAVVARRDRG